MRSGDAPPTALANLAGKTSNRIARATLAVSHPNDPAEREAEALASRVAHGGSPPTAAPAPAHDEATLLARDAQDAPAAGPAREEVAEGGDLQVSDKVTSLIASPGSGAPMDPAVQAKVQPHLGADLSTVRVHQGPEVGGAASELQARAFTVGADIFLGEGESPADLELMAHEATHVVQQQAVGVYRADVMRFGVADVVPDVVLDAIRAIPGYSIVALLLGKDPITDEPVTGGAQAFVEKLLSFGPFAAAIGPVLQAVDVLGDIVTLLRDGLAAHNLTLARLEHDIGAAWDEVGIRKSDDENLAIIRRYVNGIVSDITAFVEEVKDAVLAKVREVIAAAVTPLLERPTVAPWWNLAIKVLHQNPLTGEQVNATTLEIITDFLKVAGQEKVLAQMEERKILPQTAEWVDSKIGQFLSLVGDVGALLEKAKAALTPSNLPNLLDTLPALADEAVAIVHKVGDFAQDVLLTILDLVKKSLLEWLSGYAKKLPGYELLTVLLEKDPFTEVAVPRTAENLIKGFILLLPGGDAMYAKLAESGVIADAAGRIESAMTELNISWQLITDTFQGVWNLVTLDKLLTPLATFDEILAKFGDPLDRIITFAAVVIRVVVELILRLMNFPPELLGRIIDNAMAAIDDIKKDPVAFLINVLEAMKRGFSAFFDKIAGYLLKGLSDWMFRGLRTLGIEPPAELTLQAAITLVIQVSGVTVESLWAKLGAKIGEDKVAKIRAAIELAGEAFAFIKDIQERGMAAIWDKISEQLSNLWDLIFDAAKQWLMSEIIDKAVAKVLSMLDPTGIMAVVRSAQAIFNGIQSVLDYARELLELIDSYVSTVASIAKGDVGPGAAMLERGLANAVPVAIGFLANQAGVGDLPEKVKEIVIGLRLKIDEAIDWLLDKAISLGKAALDALGLGGDEDDEDDGLGDAEFEGGFEVENEQHMISIEGGEVMVASNNKQKVAEATADAKELVQKITAEYAKEQTKKARNTAVRKAVKKLKALLKKHPEIWNQLGVIGHAPNIAIKATWNAQERGWQPQSGQAKYMPYWELEAEHVVPDMFITTFFEWYEVPFTTDQEYNSMITIMIYERAAEAKTQTDHSARADLKNELARVNGVRAAEAIFESYVDDAVTRTNKAVIAEAGDKKVDLATNEPATKVNKDVRGGAISPTRAEIKAAAVEQAKQIEKMAADRRKAQRAAGG